MAQKKKKKRKTNNKNDKVYRKALTFEDMKQQQKQPTSYFSF